MDLMNIGELPLARVVRLPATKEGWIAVIICALVLFASQWILGKLLEGTSLEENQKQTVTKIASYVIAFVVMLLILV